MSKSIIIDAGHGGSDSGARAFGVNEKDWCLKISQYQFKRLKELGAKVTLTRNSDVTLEPTQRIARIKNQYDICVSNHWNAFNGQARGVESIHSIHAKSAFAEDLAKRVVEATTIPFRRVFTRQTTHGKDYYFMHRLTGRTETVIIEYGFLDNQQDHQAYMNEKIFLRATEAIIEGICHKIGVKYVKDSSVGRDTEQSSKDPINSSKESFIGKRVESIHNGELRFYNRPSWQDNDVFGYLSKGQGFPNIREKINVGSGKQYRVQNSKGQTFYVTASPKYVKVK